MSDVASSPLCSHPDGVIRCQLFNLSKPQLSYLLNGIVAIADVCNSWCKEVESYLRRGSLCNTQGL